MLTSPDVTFCNSFWKRAINCLHEGKEQEIVGICIHFFQIHNFKKVQTLCLNSGTHGDRDHTTLQQKSYPENLEDCIHYTFTMLSQSTIVRRYKNQSFDINSSNQFSIHAFSISTWIQVFSRKHSISSEVYV